MGLLKLESQKQIHLICVFHWKLNLNFDSKYFGQYCILVTISVFKCVFCSGANAAINMCELVHYLFVLYYSNLTAEFSPII